MTRALEERHADLVLELPNLLAERRLRVCRRLAARVKLSSSATATK